VGIVVKLGKKIVGSVERVREGMGFGIFGVAGRPLRMHIDPRFRGHRVQVLW